MLLAGELDAAILGERADRRPAHRAGDPRPGGRGARVARDATGAIQVNHMIVVKAGGRRGDADVCAAAGEPRRRRQPGDEPVRAGGEPAQPRGRDRLRAPPGHDPAALSTVEELSPHDHRLPRPLHDRAPGALGLAQAAGRGQEDRRRALRISDDEIRESLESEPAAASSASAAPTSRSSRRARARWSTTSATRRSARPGRASATT